MNYGADAADQIVRYTLDGVEHTLKISGAVAKNLAIFIAAVMKDQKKTRGRTRMERMLRERKPMKFFSVPKDRLKEFAQEAKSKGNYPGQKTSGSVGDHGICGGRGESQPCAG